MRCDIGTEAVGRSVLQFLTLFHPIVVVAVGVNFVLALNGSAAAAMERPIGIDRAWESRKAASHGIVGASAESKRVRGRRS